jgi:epoxyqueuosine reductase
VGARELDARRCISYLTIEQRGAIAEPLRPRLGSWIFGCDVCQDVCPFNRTAPLAHDATEPFQPAERWARPASELLTMDEAAFASYAEGSPIKRPGRVGMARNAAIVLGNSGDKRHLPLLAESARSHDSAVVRDAASWAAARLRGGVLSDPDRSDAEPAPRASAPRESPGEPTR